jgi:hypothetical protein
MILPREKLEALQALLVLNNIEADFKAERLVIEEGPDWGFHVAGNRSYRISYGDLTRYRYHIYSDKIFVPLQADAFRAAAERLNTGDPNAIVTDTDYICLSLDPKENETAKQCIDRVIALRQCPACRQKPDEINPCLSE